jgi:hypothetical protein
MHKRTSILMSSLLMTGVAAAIVLGSLGSRASVSAAPAAPAGEHRVCPSGCTYSSIQAAVDATQPGDVVKVAQGTYTDLHHTPSLDTATFTATQIVAITKSITIRGGYSGTDWNLPDLEAHPTILDAGGQGRVMVIVGNGITPIVEGLRLTGGDAAGLAGDIYWGYDVGGGVYAYRAAPKLKNNWVFSNTAQAGGGLFLHEDIIYEDSAYLEANQVLSNSASLRGGGLYLAGGRFTVSGCHVARNRSTGNGGGLFLAGGSPTLVGNVIADNEAEGTYGHGGGLYLHNCDGTLRQNRVTGNKAGGNGGGIEVYKREPLLEANILMANVARQGGGLSVDDSAARIVNQVIVGNQASLYGSGLWIRRSVGARLLHTTIAENSGGDGSGVYVTNHSEACSTVMMTNTIISHHGLGIVVTGGNTATLDATLWYTNTGGNTDGDGAIITYRDHTGAPAFAADGYHLTASSAAIEEGVSTDVTTDIDGDARPTGDDPDLGADEFVLRHIYLPLIIRH